MTLTAPEQISAYDRSAQYEAALDAAASGADFEAESQDMLGSVPLTSFSTVFGPVTDESPEAASPEESKKVDPEQEAIQDSIQPVLALVGPNPLDIVADEYEPSVPDLGKALQSLLAAA